MGSIFNAATRKFAPGTAGWLEQQMIRYGPLSNLQRPAFQVVTKAFSGASAGQMGARLSAGFDLGTGAAGETTIEKAIAETDPLESGITLPFLGDLVDWAAFVMVPEKFLPFSAKGLSNAARSLQGDTMLRPFAHAFQANTNMGLRQAADLAKETVKDEYNVAMRLDYGIHVASTELVHSAGLKGGYNQARAQIIRDLKAEGSMVEVGGVPVTGEGGNLVTSATPLARELLSHSLSRPDRFEGWLIELAGVGRGPNIVTNYAEAAKLSRMATRDVRDGRVLVTDTPSAFVVGPSSVTPEGQYVSGAEIGGIKGQGFDVYALKKEAESLENTIKRQKLKAQRAQIPSRSAR